jgi:hypothetical protein
LAFHSGSEADHSSPSGAGVREWVEVYLHSPNGPSWRGARLGGAQGQLYLYFTFYLIVIGETILGIYVFLMEYVLVYFALLGRVDSRREKLLLCLTKNYVSKTYGKIKVQLHPFLISALV